MSRRRVAKRYLTVVPAISKTLDGPANGGDDTEDTCNPMAATKDADRLNYARGSGARMNIVGSLVRIWAIRKPTLGYRGS